MSLTNALLFSAIGFVGLTIGAEWLVRGASRIAAVLGVSPMVIGLTVVAYGTSAPEIIASVVAAIQGHPEVTLGNVLGSNIANIGLILGIAAVVSPFAVALKLMRRELAFMMLVTVLFIGAAFRLQFDWPVGVIFLLLLLGFNYFTLRWARAEPPQVQEEFKSYEEAKGVGKYPGLGRNVGLTTAGLGLLFGGGHLLVVGAVEIAHRAGISEVIIGLTLVAVGTSLPELATSVIAVRRGEADILVGNLVGSNLFNILGALALSAVITPVRVDAALLRFEFPALLVFSLGMVVVLATGKRVTRWEGIALLAAYATFIAALFLI